jgi:hypothetical protein
VAYDKVSAELGIPVGSIGPNRGRCLDKQRRHPAIAALINAGQANAEPVRQSSAAMTNISKRGFLIQKAT